MKPFPADPIRQNNRLVAALYEEDCARSLERALFFGAFLGSLCQPTPAQQWLTRAAAQLEAQQENGGRKRTKRQTIVHLLNRDGPNCWFCDKPLSDDITVEHLQPMALGGSGNEDNLALAHSGCNKAAGHLSRIKKEHLREQMQSNSGGTGRDNLTVVEP